MSKALLGQRWSIVSGLLLLLVLPLSAHAEVTARDVLIKGSGKGATVYYLAADGKRHVFPNEKTYKSWFSRFTDVLEVSNQELASFPIGGAVTYRPGVRLVKIQTDPKVYAVDKGGELRWLETEDVAVATYGANWNMQIDDIPEALFANYKQGKDVKAAADFDPVKAAAKAETINDDKDLPHSEKPPKSDTKPGKPEETGPPESTPSGTIPATPAVPATPPTGGGGGGGATPATPATPAVPSSPTPDTTGPLITSLSISPTNITPGQAVTFTVTAQDPAGIGNVIYDILYPDDGRYDGPFYIRPNCNFNLAASGTCSFTQSIDHASSPTILGEYTIVIRAADALGNVATYRPDGTVTNGSQATHSLTIPAITVHAADATPPTLTPVSLASTRPGQPTVASNGDTVNLTFTASEPLFWFAVTWNIGGNPATLPGGNINLSGNTWEAHLHVKLEDANGPVGFTINYEDFGHNAGATVTGTTDGSFVNVSQAI